MHTARSSHFLLSSARFGLLFLFLTGALGNASAQDPGKKKQKTPLPTPTHGGLVYSSPNGVDLALDLYLPEGDGPHPVVVWIHGGGWKNGSRNKPKNLFLQKEGIAVASITYRLIPSQWPSQLDDCRAAIRYLRQNADTYQLDPEAVGVMGSSAPVAYTEKELEKCRKMYQSRDSKGEQTSK